MWIMQQIKLLISQELGNYKRWEHWCLTIFDILIFWLFWSIRNVKLIVRLLSSNDYRVRCKALQLIYVLVFCLMFFFFHFVLNYLVISFCCIVSIRLFLLWVIFHYLVSISPTDNTCRILLWLVWCNWWKLLGGYYLWEHSIWGVTLSQTMHMLPFFEFCHTFSCLL